MADISVRGYANKVKTIDGAKGPFTVFTLSEKVKGRDGESTRTFYDVTDFNRSGVAEGAYVTVKGWFKTRDYTRNDGSKGLGLTIKAESIEIAPPREGDRAPVANTADDDFGF